MKASRVLAHLSIALVGGALALSCSSKEEGKQGVAKSGTVSSKVDATITCGGDGKEWKGTLAVEAVRQCRYSATGKGLTIELGPLPGAATHSGDVMKILLANYAGAGKYVASGPTIPTRIDLSATREGEGTEPVAITTWACDQECVIEVGPNDLLKVAPNTEVSVPLTVRCPKIGEVGSGCKVACSMKPDPIELLLRCSGG